MFAAAHLALEVMQLHFEAKACGTTLARYFATCFNGRLGWTPFLENMLQLSHLNEVNDNLSFKDES